MTAEPELIGAISAAGGASLVGLIVRLAIAGWMKRLADVVHLADKLLVDITTIKVQLLALQRDEDRVRNHAIQIALLESHVADAQKDLNGLGRKLGSLFERKT